MKAPIRILFVVSALLFFTNCGGSDDDASDPEIMIDPDPIPGKTSTYTGDVKAIIDTHCLECHGDPLDQGAPMMLINYDQTVNAVESRDLFGRVATRNAFNVMPQSGRLPQATITIIEDWIADGLVE
ncbi:hypothetical protein [Aquimarina sp. RZ0]|uniref:hypothetical protein n=1 Tax=Aquimarina sp. RZ0 TaxID=2607730 RepID=UPI0011F27159|nr:hypothetical protein [Aquimarina sp. RZ0]KAA1242478.1 hypothetical protein F0000_25500 [Aquimarina sp. RZ0]